MILDCEGKDGPPRGMFAYMVIEKATGKRLDGIGTDGLTVIRADDSTGVVRHYVKSDDGTRPLYDAQGNPRIADWAVPGGIMFLPDPRRIDLHLKTEGIQVLPVPAQDMGGFVPGDRAFLRLQNLDGYESVYLIAMLDGGKALVQAWRGDGPGTSARQAYEVVDRDDLYHSVGRSEDGRAVGIRH